ncbi:uncharacterized protein LODBEIA_P13320 [Lodderomyces beijingensis]|uniref:Zn(2)-C6 fungal-type domain-containing protein n=1 Tax=Lodderomyces beijingensis TaxID=1775926 RepID=A0ABP0ZG26_9ASCO
MRARRGYSKGGCRECKRLKRKCTEEKPSCKECIRLSKVCTYPEAGESVQRVSRKVMRENPKRFDKFETAKARRRAKPLTIQMYHGPEKHQKRTKTVAKETSPEDQKFSSVSSLERLYGRSFHSNSFPQSNMRSHSAQGESQAHTPSQFHHEPTATHSSTIQQQDVPQSSQFGFHQGGGGGGGDVDPNSLLLGDVYNNEDLSVLAADLNNLVNDIMFTSNISQHQEDFDQNLFDPYFNIPTVYVDDIPKHIPLDYINLKTDDERRYLKEFYDIFAMEILPFGAFDKNTGLYSNPIRDVIMKYAAGEPFLLSAVLSQGAKLESNKKSSTSKKDLENCGTYLSACLKLLGPALSRNRDKLVKDDLTSNIESILITVLLLTSSSATTEKQSWRPHLKGAKDIIVKATNRKIRSSKTLILCKLWFADFEILAGLSSDLGGTLRTKEEMDSVLNFDDEYVESVLRQSDLIQDNGFNVVSGYHKDCTPYFKTLCELVRQKRENERFLSEDSLEYLDLISGFHSQYMVTFFTRIPHTTAQTINGFITDSTNLMGSLQKIDGSTLRISWMDISQQAYSLAGLITVFTELLQNPAESTHVKHLVTKVVNLIRCFENTRDYMNMTFPYAFSMIQWPVAVAGTNCTERRHYPLIENFFGICCQLGSFNAKCTLERLKKLWALRESGQPVANVESDDFDKIAY